MKKHNNVFNIITGKKIQENPGFSPDIQEKIKTYNRVSKHISQKIERLTRKSRLKKQPFSDIKEPLIEAITKNQKMRHELYALIHPNSSDDIAYICAVERVCTHIKLGMAEGLHETLETKVNVDQMLIISSATKAFVEIVVSDMKLTQDRAAPHKIPRHVVMSVMDDTKQKFIAECEQVGLLK